MSDPASLKGFWADGGSVVNAWLGINSPVSSEMMAKLNWDTVTVDTQHGMVDLGAGMTMLQAITAANKVPLVRVPWNDPAWIMKFLDSGALGVICPMVNNREECEAFVGACRYAPDGYRSWGPVRIPFSDPLKYKDWANANIATLAMIETSEALNNLDEILSVPGLDAIYVGPSDLAISLGEAPAPIPSTPKVVEAVATILEAANRHGIIPGIHCGSGGMAKEYLAAGWRLVTILNDARLMVAGASAAIAEARA